MCYAELVKNVGLCITIDHTTTVGRNAVCWVYRVPETEDLFYGRLANLSKNDSLDFDFLSYCIYDSGNRRGQCGRRAVHDTTAEDIAYEPNIQVRLGVPITGGRRRRKLDIDAVDQRNDGRVYLTSYR